MAALCINMNYSKGEKNYCLNLIATGIKSASIDSTTKVKAILQWKKESQELLNFIK